MLFSWTVWGDDGEFVDEGVFNWPVLDDYAQSTFERTGEWPTERQLTQWFRKRDVRIEEHPKARFEQAYVA